MIINKLIRRPIGVSMSLLVIGILSVLSVRYIPVSLMPDIDIPQISVRVSFPGASAQEVDAKAISPLRHQLSQVAGLKRIRSESKADGGTIFMDFEPGSDVNLLFIEVNEKTDRALNALPRELSRPKIFKASAIDIPAFFLNITLKDEHEINHTQQAGERFAEMSDFVSAIVTKRIEQLPQTAMVDVSGGVSSEIVCTPKQSQLEAAGLSRAKIEQAIQQNNITLNAITVADGIYRYRIHFDNQLLTKEDIGNIYIRHNERLYQLKELCDITEQPTKRSGLIRHDGKNAISIAVIKQNDAKMQDLRYAINNLIEDLEKEHPQAQFELVRDQTKLLSFSMDSLEKNLYLGAFCACLVLFLFMRDWRLSFLIMLTIPLSMLVTLLSFFLLDISLNIISLSGLILGVGMIVDNSIIVIDNIMQKWKSGDSVSQATVSGSSEVFTPMLSSVLTTCSVFLPLIFLSGIAGALFYDQAMGMTIALFASLFVAVLVIPVYFFALYKRKSFCVKVATQKRLAIDIYKWYDKALRWSLKHSRGVALFSLFLILPTYFIYQWMPKEKLPRIAQTDALVRIDWNKGISAEENDKRVNQILQTGKEQVTTSSAVIGVHDFMLAHTPPLSSSEAILYIQAPGEEELNIFCEKVKAFVSSNYPEGTITFEPSGNIFDLIFSSNEPDLEIHLQNAYGGRPSVEQTKSFVDSLSRRFPNLLISPVLLEKNIRYWTDLEKMTQYGISYDMLLSELSTLVKQNQIYHLSSGNRSVPVIIGSGSKESEELLQHNITSPSGTRVPLLSLIRDEKVESFKQLFSGQEGGYYPIALNLSDEQVEEVIAFVDAYVRQSDQYAVTYHGSYFSSRVLVQELIVVWIVAIALLYFILAAQFESVVLPLLILSELVVDLFFVFAALWIFQQSLNIMTVIGLVVTCGIIINDSILKVDTIHRLHTGGKSVTRAILEGGHSRFKPIIMTSLTTILAVLPFLSKGDMGSALQFPLSLTLVIGMIVGTGVSLFFVPVMYLIIYRKSSKRCS